MMQHEQQLLDNLHLCSTSTNYSNIYLINSSYIYDKKIEREGERDYLLFYKKWRLIKGNEVAWIHLQFFYILFSYVLSNWMCWPSVNSTSMGFTRPQNPRASSQPFDFFDGKDEFAN